MTITKHNRHTNRDEKRTYKLSEALEQLAQGECLNVQDEHHAFIRPICGEYVVTGSEAQVTFTAPRGALRMAIQLAQGA